MLLLYQTVNYEVCFNEWCSQLLRLCSSGTRWWINEWMNEWMNESINQSIWNIGGIIMTRENRRTWRKACPNATLSTINPTKIGLGLKLGLPRERLATNCLSHGMDSWIMNKYFTKHCDTTSYLVHRTNFYAWVDVLQPFWCWGVITQIFIFCLLHTSIIYPNS
jgi:hypothetical protein